MLSKAFQKLQAKAFVVARSLPKPAFYGTHSADVQRADDSLVSDDIISRCRTYLDASRLECAHGLFHCEAVARDAGAIFLVEARELGIPASQIDSLFVIAIVSGLLHDIKRKEDDHAVRGSIEAEKILTRIGVGLRERQYVADAIRNHEAFQETFERSDQTGRLISDALYDADKFRWGPENFTTTLWLMVESRNTSIESLHAVFREKMKGIEKIKDTFRTSTGRRFGPEFIEQGITIGNAIYDEMSLLLQNGS
jgi:hypothetical protein